MYPQGRTPAGVADMSGNVWEWCLNEYSKPEPVSMAGEANRVVRGGSWDYDRHVAAAVVRGDDLLVTVTTVSASGWCVRSLFFSSALLALCARRSDPLARLRGGAGEGFSGGLGVSFAHPPIEFARLCRDPVLWYTALRPPARTGQAARISCGAARGTTIITMPPPSCATAINLITITTISASGWCVRSMFFGPFSGWRTH